MSLQLLGLPAELLHRCLYFLDGYSLLNCRRINRLFNTIIKQSTALQYAIELFAACAEDNPSCALSVSEKLQRLHRRQDAWHRFIRHKFISVDVQHIPSGIYDFTGGVYILGEAPQGMSRFTSGLKYICLPSLDELEDDKEVQIPWHSMETKDAIVDLGMAIQEHDLIAVVTQRTVSSDPSYTRDIFIEFIQFSTGKPHPLASKPMFTVYHNVEALGHASIGIEIVGDLLVLLLTFPFSPTTDDRLFVYNWKTATRTIVHTAHPNTYTSFTFISPTALVMPNNRLATLELFDLTAIGARATLIPVRLNLPALRLRCRIIRAACRGEPNPAPAGLNHRSDQPFHDRAEDALIVFNFLIQQQPRAHGLIAVSCVVHRSTLLDWFERRRYADGELELFWEDWGGPRGTRWFDANFVVTRWVTTTCGQRFAVVKEDGPSRISVMDFNPYRVRRIMADDKALPEGVEIPAKTVREAIRGREKRRAFAADGIFDSDMDMDEMDADYEQYGFALYEEEEGVWDEEEDQERVRMDMVPIEKTEEATVWLNCLPTSLPEDLEVFAIPVESSLPYVETVTKRRVRFDAVLIDGERIIGMYMDELHDRVRKVDILYMG
ncbi:hypothetical protein OE88DRAFT_1654217 [Heliocybe sulcata]|uniref:F-box domain-containing protein n=1 Tax=Heliocybe sulcata TaxID=5364 RepID=A0A5C3N960_9AGAM|nr:hypothetical protein OE88DRAFT_1654217 [Heliocybe sulcata]